MSAATPTESRLQPVLTASLHPSPTNPRKTFAGDAWDTFVENVRAVGIMQPILVRPWPEGQAVSGVYALGVPLYEIVAGERRYRAAIACGLDMVPALIRDLSTAEVVRLQMVENLQREDLHPLEEAEGYALMVREHGFSADTLAAEIGKSRAYIYGRMKLLEACDHVKAKMRAGELAMSIGELIARIPSTALQMQAMSEVLNRDMTYKIAAAHIQARYMLTLKSAPFPLDDADLIPAAGTCAACPKRTGNAQDLFSDVSSADVCTDPDCYRDKKVANMRRLQAAAEAGGAKVLTGDSATEALPYGADSMAGRGFVKASDRVEHGPSDAKGKAATVEQVAKQAGVQPMLVADERSGRLVKVFKAAEVKNAAKKAGDHVVIDQNDKQRQAERERKFEMGYRTRLYSEIRAKIAAAKLQPGIPSAELRQIASTLYRFTGFEGQNRIVHFWVTKEEVSEAHARCGAVQTRIPSMTDNELLLLMIDCTVGHCIQIWSGSTTFTLPDALADLAERWSVDATALRVAMKKEAKEAGKGTKKGSAKKVAADTCATGPAQAEAPAPRPLRVGDHCRIVLHRLDDPAKQDQNAMDHGVIITRKVSDPNPSDTTSNTGGIYWARPAGPIVKKPNDRGFKVDTTPTAERCYTGRGLELWSPIPRIGDRVRVRDGLRGPDNKARKVCGREGVVETVENEVLTVRFGKKSHEIAANLTPSDVEILPPAPIAAAQAQEQIAPEKQAKGKPAKAWPFPRGPVSAPAEAPDEAKPKLKAARPKSAAQAAKPIAPKSNEQAASAARKKSSGRASPAGGDEGAGATAGDDEGAIERCTRTIDMLDGQAACEQGASA